MHCLMCYFGACRKDWRVQSCCFHPSNCINFLTANFCKDVDNSSNRNVHLVLLAETVFAEEQLVTKRLRHWTYSFPHGKGRWEQFIGITPVAYAWKKPQVENAARLRLRGIISHIIWSVEVLIKEDNEHIRKILGRFMFWDLPCQCRST